MLLMVTGCSSGRQAQPSSQTESERTEAMLERGRYLAEAVALCVECHSERDYSKPGGPIVPGTAYAGGHLFTPDFSMAGQPFPGRLQAPNITQDEATGIGAWSAADIRNAVQRGVSRNGTPMFPVMPYLNYRHMRAADVQALIAFLETVAPVPNETAERELLIPDEALAAQTGDNLPLEPFEINDELSKGRYLVTIGGCSDCHTPVDEEGMPDMDRFLAGGVTARTPDFEVVSSNLTPDPDTGLGRSELQDFKAAMREGIPIQTAGRQDKLHPFMPWLYYRNMTDEDLAAIWAFLQSIPPVRNDVVTYFANAE